MREVQTKIQRTKASVKGVRGSAGQILIDRRFNDWSTASLSCCVVQASMIVEEMRGKSSQKEA
jgi:hypothetical protein